MEIRYIKYNDIDIARWDKCIAQSVNGIVYAQSSYLNIVCKHWDALVMGNYDAVMPLPWKRIYRFKILYQPLFTQQLGVFSRSKISPGLVDKFITETTRYFPYININLNTFNQCTLTFPDISERVTYELDLIEPYQNLQKKYSENTKRNIKTAFKEGIQIIDTTSTDEFIKLKRRNQVVNLKYPAYKKLKRIINHSIESLSGKLYGAYDSDNHLCASAFFTGSHKKVIYLVSASNEQGKKKRAMFMLIDEFIKKFAGNHLTLDFEGSMIPNIARFFASFGAKPCIYQNIRINNLPWYIKILR